MFLYVYVCVCVYDRNVWARFAGSPKSKWLCGSAIPAGVWRIPLFLLQCHHLWAKRRGTEIATAIEAGRETGSGRGRERGAARMRGNGSRSENPRSGRGRRGIGSAIAIGTDKGTGRGTGREMCRSAWWSHPIPSSFPLPRPFSRCRG